MFNVPLRKASNLSTEFSDLKANPRKPKPQYGSPRSGLEKAGAPRQQTLPHTPVNSSEEALESNLFSSDFEDEPKKSRSGRRQRVEDLPRDEQLDKAKDIILTALTMMPRTRHQLAEKLATKEIPEDVANEALNRLTEVGLIDDKAFAEVWVTSRHQGAGLAGSAIRRELVQKGVDPDFIEAALENLDSDMERERALELVRRRAPSTKRLAKDARTRRLAGMLARKGYGGMAFAVVKQVLTEEAEDQDNNNYEDTDFLDSGED